MLLLLLWFCFAQLSELKAAAERGPKPARPPTSSLTFCCNGDSFLHVAAAAVVCFAQLSELQAAAEGVPGWERQLAREPSGADLVLQIAALDAARFRLVWLQQEGLEGRQKSALAVLQMSAKRFQQKYPEYPGDAAFADSD